MEINNKIINLENFDKAKYIYLTQID